VGYGERERILCGSEREALEFARRACDYLAAAGGGSGGGVESADLRSQISDFRRRGGDAWAGVIFRKAEVAGELPGDSGLSRMNVGVGGVATEGGFDVGEGVAFAHGVIHAHGPRAKAEARDRVRALPSALQLFTKFQLLRLCAIAFLR